MPSNEIQIKEFDLQRGSQTIKAPSEPVSNDGADRTLADSMATKVGSAEKNQRRFVYISKTQTSATSHHPNHSIE